MPINMRRYWDQLSESIQTFQIFPTSETDQKNFDEQKNTLERMSKKGLEIESLGWKIVSHGERMGRDLKAISEEVYNDQQGVPEITGPLSLAFAEQVYLPHIMRLEEVDFGNLAKLAPPDLAPQESKRIAQENARILRARIEAYKSACPIASQATPEEELKEIASLNSLEELKKFKVRLENKINQLNYNLILLEKSRDALDLFLGQMEEPETRKAKSMMEILDVGNEYKGNLEKFLNESPFTAKTKTILLNHEENKKSIFSFITYKPFPTLQSCVEIEKKERDKLNKKIADIRTTKEKTEETLAITQHVIEEVVKEASESETSHIKDALSKCLRELMKKTTNSVFRNSSKGIKIIDLNNKLKDIVDIENVKNQVRELKKHVSEHRDKKKWYGLWTIGRNPKSLNIFNEFFDKENNPKQSNKR